MTRTRLSLVALLSVGALAAAGCGGGKSSDSSSSSSGVPNDAVATVAGDSVTRAELDDLVKIAALSYKQNKQAFPKSGTTEYQALQLQAAAYLVTQKEYEQDAARRGLAVTDANIDKAIDALVKDRFEGDRKKFDAYLKTTGYTLDEWKGITRRQLVQSRLSKDVTKGLKVSDAEVKAYYEKNKNSPPYTTTPAQRRVRHILVALNAKGVGTAAKGVTDTTVDFAKSKALADKLYKQLAAGASFAAYVKKYSQDPGSKDKGGEYTDVKGTFAPEFEQAAFTLGTNAISKPVKTQFGYHLIQPLAPTKPAGPTQPYAKAAKSIRALLLQQKQQPVLQKWSAALSEKYTGKVKYAVGFEPPAATSTGTTTTP